jgi:CheY-like chemotaxis protein
MKVKENVRYMLVDDDREVLAVMGEVLANFGGAEVASFSAPMAAIHSFRANPSVFDIIISDFDMPGLDGVEMCHVLRGLIPHVKTILATGNIKATESEAAAQGFDALLHKPFSISALEEAIKRVQSMPAQSNRSMLLQAA